MRRRRRKNSTGFPAIAVTDHPIAGSHTHISSHGRDVGHPCLKQGCSVSGRSACGISRILVLRVARYDALLQG
jgi:hypothetical protein